LAVKRVEEDFAHEAAFATSVEGAGALAPKSPRFAGACAFPEGGEGEGEEVGVEDDEVSVFDGFGGFPVVVFVVGEDPIEVAHGRAFPEPSGVLTGHVDHFEEDGALTGDGVEELDLIGGGELGDDDDPGGGVDWGERRGLGSG
jgi:hypothetical protein